MQNLSQEYLTLISRQARELAAGTVAKPAQPNTRSDAASANEVATAISAAEDCIDPHAAPAVPAWKAACKIEQCQNQFIPWSVKSPTGKFWWSSASKSWVPDNNPSQGSHFSKASAELSYKECNTCPPDWPTAAHTDDPREEPEPFCEATGPMPTPTPVPAKPKPCESIERLVDRLAKVNGAIEVSHGMTYRVTGNVEKAEPRSWDTPGYPAHFSLHHVYMSEDWTRGVLMSIAYGLEGKLDKGTIRTVLEQVSRSLVLTGELDEADLIGLAVAVEDKLDIGK